MDNNQKKVIYAVANCNILFDEEKFKFTNLKKIEVDAEELEKFHDTVQVAFNELHKARPLVSLHVHCASTNVSDVIEFLTRQANHVNGRYIPASEKEPIINEFNMALRSLDPDHKDIEVNKSVEKVRERAAQIEKDASDTRCALAVVGVLGFFVGFVLGCACSSD